MKVAWKLHKDYVAEEGYAGVTFSTPATMMDVVRALIIADRMEKQDEEEVKNELPQRLGTI